MCKGPVAEGNMNGYHNSKVSVAGVQKASGEHGEEIQEMQEIRTGTSDYARLIVWVQEFCFYL